MYTNQLQILSAQCEEQILFPHILACFLLWLYAILSSLGIYMS